MLGLRFRIDGSIGFPYLPNSPGRQLSTRNTNLLVPGKSKNDLRQAARWIVALAVGFVGLWWMLPFTLSVISVLTTSGIPSDEVGDLLFVAVFLLATVAALTFPARLVVTTFRKVGFLARLGIGIATATFLPVYLACLLVVPVSCHLGVDQNAPPHCHTLLEAASHLH